MVSECIKSALHQDYHEQLIQARRELRGQENRLAQLKYEWAIAKRLRTQAPNEDEREKWRVQSDAYMALVLQQESVIDEIKEDIERHRSRLAAMEGLDTSETG
jgi:hypothetical protein